jgi:cytochrome c oxidase assembly protein subunit 11
MYEFQNVQNRRMAAQAIPSYAPRQAAAHFNKLECFCFNQYTLEPGEKKEWPVAFVIDPKLSKDVTTITLSYTFFEVGGKTPRSAAAHVGRFGAQGFAVGRAKAHEPRLRFTAQRKGRCCARSSAVAWSLIGLRKGSEYAQDWKRSTPCTSSWWD